jgi:deoxyribonuclease V
VRIEPLHPWDLSPRDAVAVQRELRERLVLRPPAGFAVRLAAGADVAVGSRLPDPRRAPADRGVAGLAVLELPSLRPVEEVGAVVTLRFPYVPGLLSFRELPAVAEAWDRLATRPDVLVFDGQGYAHPRRFGLACHGGLLFGVPSVGCAKSLLVGRHGPLAESRGATAPIVDRGEVVGMALRLRAGVQPVYVSAGHLMDLDTAVEVVRALGAGYREPETTRRAHRLVTRLRREGTAGEATG